MSKLVGLLIGIVGIAVFMFGSYTASQAAKRENRIAQIEKNSQGRPTLGPVRRRMQEQAAQTKQSRISQANEQIASTQVTSDWLRGTGAVLFLVGIGTFVYASFRKRDH